MLRTHYDNFILHIYITIHCHSYLSTLIDLATINVTIVIILILYWYDCL